MSVLMWRPEFGESYWIGLWMMQEASLSECLPSTLWILPQSLTTLVFICIQDIWYISRHRNTHSAYPVLLHSSFLVAGFDLLSFFRQSFQQFLSDIIPPFTPIHSLTIKKELTHHNKRQHYTYIVSYSVCLWASSILALKVLHGCVNNML